jgi:hypothetical protein
VWVSKQNDKSRLNSSDPFSIHYLETVWDRHGGRLSLSRFASAQLTAGAVAFETEHFMRKDQVLSRFRYRIGVAVIAPKFCTESQPSSWVEAQCRKGNPDYTHQRAETTRAEPITTKVAGARFADLPT